MSIVFTSFKHPKLPISITNSCHCLYLHDSYISKFGFMNYLFANLLVTKSINGICFLAFLLQRSKSTKQIFHHDVGLVKTVRQLPTEYIIQLPDKNEDFTGQTCKAAGWGLARKYLVHRTTRKGVNIFSSNSFDSNLATEILHNRRGHLTHA